MRASHRWLTELTGLSLTPEEMARTFTSVGLEVETVTAFGAGLDHVVIARVVAWEAHPKKSGLRLVTVDDGTETQVIVCGAPNVPDAGGRVVLAKLGATLPGGMVIAPRTIAGTPSSGMLCGETELGIGSDDSGLFLVPAECTAPLGTPLADALALRDHVLEIGLTPNRPDALGHRGLARELCAARGAQFVPEHARPLSFEGAPGVQVRVEDAERCPRYGALRIEGVVVGPSPFADRYRLHCLGLRAISNVVDATNLVMLEWGHPVHAFDADTLQRADGTDLVVRRAGASETLRALDGSELVLGTDDLVIADGVRPVALAGVMGGAETGVREASRNLVLECAYFAPRGVRRTSKRTGLHTDSSHRFERGVDRDDVREVLASLASAVMRSAGGQSVGAAVDLGEPARPVRIALSVARVESLIGRPYERTRVASILRSLGVGVTETDEGFDCVVPSGRVDLTREADLAEEIARIDGYDAVPVALARVRPSVEGTPARILFARALRDAAAATGLHEAISYGFTSPEELARCRAPADAVVVANPLTVERSVMRTSLLPGLASAVVRSLRGGAPEVRLFELGVSFHPRAGETLPHEAPTLAVAVAGQHEAWFGAPRAVDFFDLKGHVVGLVEAVLGRTPDVATPDRAAPAHLHPRRWGTLGLGGDEFGTLGEVHPDVGDALESPARILYAELDLVRLRSVADGLGVKLASGLPRFPGSARDLALLAPESLTIGRLVETMMRAGAPLLERAQLFDEYRGEGVPEGSRSVAFRLGYRDADATLTDARVEAAHEAVVAALVRDLGVVRR